MVCVLHLISSAQVQVTKNIIGQSVYTSISKNTLTLAYTLSNDVLGHLHLKAADQRLSRVEYIRLLHWLKLDYATSGKCCGY